MATYPKRSLIVVASETYLRAIADDLREGVQHLSDLDQLSIISAGVKKLDDLEGNLIPCDARLQSMTGGARRSLNTRLTKKILRESRVAPRASTLSKRYRKLLSEQPPIEKYNRSPISDEQVKRFIRQQLRIDKSLQHTPLLRMLRKTEKACEQKRFASLYKQVKDELYG
ncbi:MAG: hypothetical protein CME32_16295 [Gimesia sp.]|nr:hypothetical protein [Gimesia sp.]